MWLSSQWHRDTFPHDINIFHYSCGLNDTSTIGTWPVNQIMIFSVALLYITMPQMCEKADGMRDETSGQFRIAVLFNFRSHRGR